MKAIHHMPGLIKKLFSFAFLLLLHTVPFILAYDAYARAGGGVGGGGKCSGWECVIAAIIAPFVMAYTAYVWYHIHQKSKLISQALKRMAQIEPEWSETKLLRTAEKLFMRIQYAWAEQDLDILKADMHSTLYPSWERIIRGYKEINHRESLWGISINRMKIVSVRNHIDDEEDEFTVAFKVSGKETKQDKKTFEAVTERVNFTEFWTYAREQDKWVLRSISELSGWRKYIEAPIIHER